jgi:hypothetical protein
MNPEWDRLERLAFWAILAGGVLFPVSVLLHQVLTFLLELEEPFFLGLAVLVAPALMVFGGIGSLVARSHSWWEGRHHPHHP